MIFFGRFRSQKLTGQAAPITNVSEFAASFALLDWLVTTVTLLTKWSRDKTRKHRQITRIKAQFDFTAGPFFQFEHFGCILILTFYHLTCNLQVCATMTIRQYFIWSCYTIPSDICIAGLYCGLTARGSILWSDSVIGDKRFVYLVL